VAIKVSITKKAEERLRRMCSLEGFENAEEHGNFSAMTARQLVAAIDDAVKRKDRVKGLSPQEAIRIIRAVLGPAAALPPTQTAAFYSFIGKRINFLGLTAEDVEKIAIRAKHTYKLPTSVQWIMTTADRLLGEEVEVEVKVSTGREG